MKHLRTSNTDKLLPALELKVQKREQLLEFGKSLAVALGKGCLQEHAFRNVVIIYCQACRVRIKLSLFLVSNILLVCPIDWIQLEVRRQ